MTYLKRFQEENTNVLCETKEEVKDLLKKCEKENIKWCDGDKATKFIPLFAPCYISFRNKYIEYNYDLSTRIDFKTYKYKDIFKQEIKKGGIMKKEDLKYGNVVELRNKSVYLYNLTGVSLLSFNGEEGNDINQYRKDLTFINNTYPELDIMKVYKDFTFKELLWERKDIKLTDDEKVILRNLDKCFKYIARDKDSGLCVYRTKPIKMCDKFWGDGDGRDFCFDNLFQFIKWDDDEPYSIEELLKENN